MSQIVTTVAHHFKDSASLVIIIIMFNLYMAEMKDSLQVNFNHYSAPC